METRNKTELLKLHYKKIFTQEVVSEVLEQKRRELENEQKKLEILDKAKKEAEDTLLEYMQTIHPLYGSQVVSIYLERLGCKALRPFRKSTMFSKPIQEQYDNNFKPE